MVLFVSAIMLLSRGILFAGYLTGVYSKSHGNGPYTLKESLRKDDLFRKTWKTAERITVVSDVEITMLQRNYWRSYCYQGTGFDPNTGCFNDVKIALPDLQESEEWIKRNKCNIGFDCVDCYGEMSDACKDPMRGPRRYIDNKVLQKLTSNNHLARHTCNLSWGCSIHKSVFPTFITNRNGAWKKYTMFQNNSALLVDAESYWTSHDTIFKKNQGRRSRNYKNYHGMYLK